MVAKSTIKQKARIRTLYEQQEHKCYWCGREMLPPGSHISEKGKPTPKDLCTIEHMNHKFDRVPGKNGSWVAACWKCNVDRGHEREKLAGKKFIQEKSGRTGSNPAYQVWSRAVIK